MTAARAVLRHLGPFLPVTLVLPLALRMSARWPMTRPDGWSTRGRGSLSCSQPGATGEMIATGQREYAARSLARSPPRNRSTALG